jgi:hypothetical protein
MNTKGLIILCSWAGLTALSLVSLWLGEGGYSMILIFGAIFITLLVGFGMGSDMPPDEFVEIREEVSRLRGEVDAIKDMMDKIRKPIEE